MSKKAEVPATETPEEIVLTPEDAQKVIQKGRADRVAIVEKGIQDLCVAHRCALDIQITFSLFGKPEGRIVVIPRD